MERYVTQAQVNLDRVKVGAFDVKNVTLYFDVNDIGGDATYTGCLIEDEFVEQDTNEGGELHFMIELAIADMVADNHKELSEVWGVLSDEYGATKFYDFEGMPI